MNTALWIAQALLALVFLMAGLMKLTQPKEKLVPKMSFLEDLSPGQTRLIGLLEVLGAVGVVVPLLIGVVPFLTAWAAVGLMLTMVGAVITHLRCKEYLNLIPAGVLLALAAFVAWGRGLL